MQEILKKRIENFAKLIVKKGVNVQQGQEVVISAELDQPEFIECIAKECYEAGARKVRVDWTHQPLEKMAVENADGLVLGEVEAWEYAKMESMSLKLPARIYILSDDPDGLAGIDQAKYAKAIQARMKVLKPLRDRMENRYQWCIAAAPGKAWAKKLFPELKDEDAVEKLWEAILDTSRVTDDPIAAWTKHNENLSEKCAWLNSLGLERLEYKSGSGTDFTVGLIDGGMFLAGEEDTISGVPFNANIPSEEAYTSPMRGEAEGIVVASKPLSYQGELIENFSVKFRGGKAVEVKAEKGESLLRELIAMDDGAAYLGECALVPYDSPISNSGLLFYNTLFDENAACHLALGRGFTNTVKGYEAMSDEQLKEKGVNDSAVHVDFMIGTEDLEIVGVTKNGERVQIFKNGNWAEQD